MQVRTTGTNGLVIGGTVTASGTAGDEILFTRDGAANWNGVIFQGVGSGTFEHCTFEFAAVAITTSSSGTINVRDAILRSNAQGVRVNRGTVAFLRSQIVNNTSYGVYLARDPRLRQQRERMERHLRRSVTGTALHPTPGRRVRGPIRHRGHRPGSELHVVEPDGIARVDRDLDAGDIGGIRKVGIETVDAGTVARARFEQVEGGEDLVTGIVEGQSPTRGIARRRTTWRSRE